ncbi:M48 family metalloprotease [Robertkochia solimangrovi]|uniref:M48 family metalloprotease n=1 Tax=Robertkochia solimangrovi TaxID=2213046 RepID=UPI00117C7F52|nr:M48 family metalloprotease [Robertkochia solimangrovi]TRZ41418.1 M48 family peptidase [Robertkochia solimangrovi]
MRSRSGIRLVIAAVVILFAVVKYCSSTDTNPYTGKKQHITITPDQEIALGLQSAPEMAAQYGGLYPDNKAQALVDAIGQKLVQNSVARETPYQFDFHLLADPNTINAFALPGGQVFITFGLFSHLQTEAQLAGVLGHEIGHVVGRHSADQISKQDLTQGILSGVAVGSDASTTQMAAMVANLINLKYGRQDELDSDDMGVLFMVRSGYDPEGMIQVQEILRDLSGPNRAPEFQSTHPDPENRIENIKEAIRKYGTVQ